MLIERVPPSHPMFCPLVKVQGWGSLPLCRIAGSLLRSSFPPHNPLFTNKPIMRILMRLFMLLLMVLLLLPMVLVPNYPPNLPGTLRVTTLFRIGLLCVNCYFYSPDKFCDKWY